MLARLFRSLSPRGTAARKLLKQRHRLRCSLHVEALEDRLTPAATVSFIDGGASLVITGDGGDDNIIITEGAALGSFSVAGGGLNQTFTGITNIYVNLNGGANQSVTYNGAAGAGIAGTLGVSDASTTSFILTIGNDANIQTAVKHQENGAGTVAINLGAAGGAVTTLGAVTTFGSAGAATFAVDDVAMGGLSVNLNSAALNMVRVGANAAVTMGFLSVVNQASGAGSETNVSVGAGAGVTINGNVHIICGLDGNFILRSATVVGYVSFNAPNGSAGSNVLISQGTGVSISSFLSIVTGSGADGITVGNMVTVGQNFALVTKGGVDIINLADTTFSGLTSIDAGDGADVLNLAGTTSSDINTVYTGAVTIQMGAGDDIVDYGVDANDAAVFQAGGVVDGGPAANDTSNDKAFSNAASAVPATQSNFEVFTNPAANS